MKVSRFRVLVFGFIALSCLPALCWPPAGFVRWLGFQVTGLLVAGVPLLLIAAEVDAKEGSRRRDPSVHPSLAWLVPGGGRGALFVVVALIMVLLTFIAGRAIQGPGDEPFWSDDPTQLAALCMFAMCYGLLAALATGFGRSRRALRVVAVAGVIVGALIAMRVGGALVHASMDLGLVLVPPLMLEYVRPDGLWAREAFPAFIVLCGATALLLGVSVPHILRGVREVVRLRDERRGRSVAAVR